MENNKGKRKQNKETRAHGRKTCKNKLKLIRATLMLCFAVIISACCLFSLPAIEAIAATPGSGTVEETHTTQGVTWTKNGNTWTCTINVDDDSLSWYAYESSVPSGYSTISTSSDARTVTNNAVTIANSGAKHTLTLNPNGGTVENSPTSINKDFYTYKTTMNTAPIPTRANCTFDGWYDSNTKVFNANGTANTAATAYWKVSGSNTVWNKNANVTVTARWIPHYNMTYDIGSGSWPSGAVHPSSTKQGIVFEVTKPTPPTGYNFAYWQITGMDGSTHYWDATDGSKAQGTATSGNAVVDASASTPVPATKFKNLSGTPGATVAFKAVYGEKTGVLKYNNNGHGTVPNPQNISYSQACNVAAAPSNPTGYVFQRWNTKADNSGSAFAAGAKYKEANQVVNVLGDPIGFNGNDTLYAIWKANTYNVSYELNSGSWPSGATHPTTATWDNEFTATNPTRSGWTFKGWTITGMDSNTHYWNGSAQGTATSATGVTATKFKNLNATQGASVKLTAVWERTITCKSGVNSATTGTTTQTHNADGTYTSVQPTTPAAISGWTFLGWRDDTTAGNKEFSDGNNSAISSYTGGSTLYAAYSRNAKITYANGGGSGTAPSDTSVTQYYNSGNNITTPSFKLASNTFTPPTGKHFIKWDLGNAGATYSSWTPGVSATASKTATAQWEYNTFTVTFKSGNTTLGTQSFTYGTAKNLTDIASMSNIPVSSSYGWTFNGWSTGADATREYTNGQSVSNLTTTNNGNVVLYGIWTRNASFKYYDGASATSVTTSNRTQSYYNTSATAAGVSAVSTYALATQSSYKWAPVGWVLNSNTGTSTASTATTSTANVSPAAGANAAYTALYKRTATFAYQGNGNTGGSTSATTGDQYFNAGSSAANAINLTLASNGFSRTGYSFNKWALGSASGTQKAPGDAVAFPNTGWASSNTYNVYVTWTAGSYGIAYEGMSGATHGTNHPTTATYNQAFTVNNPTKPGYNFAGWNITGMDSVTHTFGSTTNTNTSASGIKDTSFKNLRSTSGTVTFTATWTPVSYTISYAGMDGATHGSSHPTSATYDTAFTVNNPTRSGWTFTGWNVTGMDSCKHYYGSLNTTATSLSKVSDTSFKNLRQTSGTVTFTATWERTLTFKSGINNATSANVVQVYGSNVTPPTPAAISGWTFLGWRDDTTAGAAEYSNSNNAAFSYTGSATTLYAVYSRTLTVSYNNGGGSGTAPANTTVTQYYNSGGAATNVSSPSFTTNSCTFTAPTSNGGGWAFKQWTDNASATANRVNAGSAYTSWKPAANDTTVTKTLYAVWDRTVTFKSGVNEATSKTAKQEYSSASNVGLGTVTVPDGTASISSWTVSGWRTDKSAAAKTYNATGSIKPAATTVYAVYTRTLAITYAGNGNTAGSVPGNTNGTQIYNTGGNITSSLTYTLAAKGSLDKTGYDFDGWDLGAAGTSYLWENLAGVGTTSGLTKTATAKWKEKTASLSFNANGHGTAPTAITMKYTQATTLPSMSNVTGYRWKGWATTKAKADAGTVDYAGGATYKNANVIPAAATLYAVWKANAYKIKYVLNNGTAGSSAPTTGTYDSVVTISNPARVGYTFSGWTITGMDSGKHYWDNNNASTEQSGNTGVKATKFKNLTAVHNSEITLTASWAPANFTVSYDLTGGSYGELHPTAASYDAAFTVSHPTREGYDFAGWNITGMESGTTHFWDNDQGTTERGSTDTSSSGNKFTVFKNLRKTSGEIHFTATWTEQTATLTYHNNDHGTTPAAVTMKYTQAVNTAAALSATGYTFGGWSKTATGAKAYDANVLYKEANSIKNTQNDKVIKNGADLYAVWTANTYTIKYELAGGSHGSSHPTTATYDQAFTVNNPTRTGYTFQGWNITGMDSVTHTYGSTTNANTSANGIKDTSFKNLRSTSGTVTFTAVWTPNKYTVEYTGLSGATHSGSHPTTATYDEAFTVTQPTKTGYYFKGWKVTGMDSTTHLYGESASNNTSTTVTSLSGSNTLGKTWYKNLRATSGKVTFEAQWEEMTANLTYNKNGHGTAPDSVMMQYSKAVTTATMTNVEGYDFKGWAITKERADAGTVDFAGNAAFKNENKLENTKNVAVIPDGYTLYAVWQELTGTLTYDSNGHGSNPAPVTMKYSTATKVASAINYTGYTFNHWNTKANGEGKAYLPGSNYKNANRLVNINGDTVIPTGDTLYAIWGVNIYKISYDLNGGTHGSSHPGIAEYDETVNISHPTRTGYTFQGWKIEDMSDDCTHVIGDSTTTETGVAKTSATSFKNLHSTQDATVKFTAIWKVNTYSISYELNGGSHGSSHPESVNYDEDFTVSNPTKLGYTFDGWKIEDMSDTCKHYYGDSETTATSIASTKETEYKNLHSEKNAIVKFTAQWSPNTYKINYELKGGKAGSKAPETATFNEAFEVDNPTRQGYIFDGWKIEGMSDTCKHYYGDSETTATSIASTKETEYKNLHSEKNATVTFTAQWTPITYNISYTLNNGSYGTSHPTTATYDTAFTVSNPTRLGYTFTGWSISGMDKTTHNIGDSTSTNATVNGVKATTFKNLTAVADSTVTFTAQWQVNTYDIEYDLEGGEYGSKHPNKASYDAVFEISNPVREGYYFNGWTITGMDTASTHCWDNNNGSTEHGKNETATGVKQKKFKNLRAENGTVTFKATWIEMTAEVTLDNNGYGSALEPIHIRYTQQAKTPENVAITGLHVKEWNTDKDGEGIKYDPDTAFKTANSLTLAGHNDVTIIPDGITLYAIWDEEKGDLRYHANGHGTEPESFLMRYTREAAVGDALSETGWTFKGWNTKADGSGKMYQPGQKFKDAESFDDAEGNTVLPDGADLYAIWEEMNGDLTYDANGHGTAPEKTTVWFTKEHKMPATQNVVGYTFKEWNTKSNGKGYGYAIGEVYKKPNSLKSEDGTTVIPSGAKVYAIWTELKGTLKFDANGHGTAPEDMVTRYSQATTTPTMSNVEGYVFLGWATSKDHANAETVDYPAKATFKQANSLKSTDGETVIPGDVTLYAVWVADEGTLTYNAQGHGTAPEAVHIRYSKEAKVASDTMKETGWTFKEWNTKADGTGYSFAPGAAYKEEDTFFNLKGEKVIPSGDTLYAIWIENTATLTYDLNYEGAPDNTTSTMRYTQEEKVKTQVPTRGAGYTFKEWNTGKYGAATGYAPGSTFKKANVDPKDATLYAIWVEETATLTYDANGHGTAPEAETQYYSKQTKVNGSISCAGWIFVGWNTQADGRGTMYQKGSILKNPGQTPHDIVLYAIWEQERHTMTVEANGGKFSGNNDSVSYLMTVNSDEHTSFANLPTLEGKVCTGLYTRKIGGAKIYNENGKITNDGVFFKDGVFVYNSDFTLYAQWSDEPVKCVIYDKNTDDPVSNMPIEETKFLDKPITLSNKIPSREGYTFIYWCTDPTGAKGDTYYVQNGAGSVFPVNDDKAYGNYEDGPVVLYAQWQKNGEGDDAKAKLDVQYNIYTSDVENGILDAEIVYGYRNMFMQNREVKQRRTIFVDSDQELVPEVVFSTPSWAESDPIPGFPNKPKPTEPTQPTEPTEPTVEPDPEYTEVKTEEELEAAIKNFDYTKGDKLYLSLGNDIELTKSITIPIEANVDIDFEEKTLSIAASTMKPNGTDCTAALTVLGDLTIGNGTISAADACVSICDMGNFTAKEDIVFTDDATYAVFFEKGAGSATAVLLGTTVGKTDVLCGTQNQFSTLTAKDDAKIASETLYADFTSKNTDGLVIENAYTAADPTNHVNDVEYTVIENTFEDYNYRVTGTDEAVNCKVIAEPQGDGIISGTGDYRQNTTITLEAIPSPGSRFVNWVNANGDVVSTKATWTFKLTTDLELTAVFEHIPHDIEVESSDVSMGTVSGEGEYGETEQATIKATPKQGYVFSGWKKIVNGSPEDEFSSTDEEFTFTVTEDALYRAYFDAVRYTLHVDRPAYVDEEAYTIKVKINGNESELNASGDYNLDGNDSVKISASINDLSSEGGRDYTKAYTINSWVDSTSIDEGDVATLSSSSEYSFTAGEDVNAMLVLNLTDAEVNQVISNFEKAQKNYVESEFTTYTEDYLEKAQPIGSIYTSTDESLGKGDDYDDSSSENYHVDLGLLRVQDQLGGKWERIENTFLKSADNGEDIGDTGGRIKYKLSLAMTAGSGKFGYVPGSISSYLQTPSLIEGRTYSKFSKGTGAPSDNVIVTDEEQLGNELDLTPPYQSVYVFKRIDEFKGLSNITDNESEAYNHCYWFSRPGNDVLKSGYIAERLQDPDTVSGEETISAEDQAAYKKGYRYKVVEKPAENEGSGEGE